MSKVEEVCNCCLELSSDLHKCEVCDEAVCFDCLIEPKAPPNYIIDYNLCEDCYQRNR